MKYLLLITTLIIYPCYGKPSDHFSLVVNKEAHCLEAAIFLEARGQPLLGQWLVGKVILNRVSNGHPPTICGVIHQPSANKDRPLACHFSFTCKLKNYKNYIKRKKHLKEYAESARIARMLLEDPIFYDLSEGAKWYKRCEVSRIWDKELVLVIKVKNHCFYRGR